MHTILSASLRQVRSFSLRSMASTAGAVAKMGPDLAATGAARQLLLAFAGASTRLAPLGPAQARWVARVVCGVSSLLRLSNLWRSLESFSPTLAMQEAVALATALSSCGISCSSAVSRAPPPPPPYQTAAQQNRFPPCSASLRDVTNHYSSRAVATPAASHGLPGVKPPPPGAQQEQEQRPWKTCLPPASSQQLHPAVVPPPLPLVPGRSGPPPPHLSIAGYSILAAQMAAAAAAQSAAGPCSPTSPPPQCLPMPAILVALPPCASAGQAEPRSCPAPQQPAPHVQPAAAARTCTGVTAEPARLAAILAALQAVKLELEQEQVPQGGQAK